MRRFSVCYYGGQIEVHRLARHLANMEGGKCSLCKVFVGKFERKTIFRDLGV